MHDGIGIDPCLHGEGDIRCVSLEGLGVAFQKVAVDFDVVAMSKRRLGRMKRLKYGWPSAMDEWTNGEVSHSICLPIPSKNRPSCAQSDDVCAQGILELLKTYSYFHLISIAIMFNWREKADSRQTSFTPHLATST